MPAPHNSIKHIQIPSALHCNYVCLQCFDTVGWAAGRLSGLKKNTVVGCWRGFVSGSRCRFAYGPADATATLAPVNSDWFYLSGASSPGYSRTESKRAVKWLCVCVPRWAGSRYQKGKTKTTTKMLNATQNIEIVVVWGLWVTQVHRQCYHSIQRIQLPIRL